MVDPLSLRFVVHYGMCAPVTVQFWLNEATRTLANGLELGPWVGAAHLGRRVVVINVIAQFLQGGFRIRGGELSSVFDFLPHLHVDLLQTRHRQDRRLKAES